MSEPKPRVYWNPIQRMWYCDERGSRSPNWLAVLADALGEESFDHVGWP